MQVCAQLTSRQVHHKVQRGNVFFIELMGKFNVGLVVTKIFQELFQFFSTMRPNKENIDISKPYQRLKFLCIKEISFNLIYKNQSICRSKFCTDGSLWYLMFNFCIEFNIVVVNCRNLFVLSTFYYLLKSLKSCFMGNARI